jgi:eukaryotic-like serine/threonine-protein kinase
MKEPEAAMTAQQGDSLGSRYRLTERIAIGGMGEVWRALDEVLGRDVAVKLLKRELSVEPGFLERFRREARQSAMLSHPGIATVFDYGEDDGAAYLVMELVDAEPLSAVLARSGPLPTATAVSLLTQTADALAVAHRAGIVHRDVTPGNLLVSADGTVKITDFGISRMIESVPLTATGSILGTAQYLSPEQAAGRPTSSASDVYSLGVVAYEMVSGRRPFVADSHVGLAMAHLNDTPPPLPSDVPDGLAAVISTALRKEPGDRPADGAAFAAALRALGPGERSSVDTRTRAVPATARLVPVDVPATTVTPPTATMPLPVALPSGTAQRAEAQPLDERPQAEDAAAPLLGESLTRRRPLRRALVAAAALALVVLAVLAGRDPADLGEATATTATATSVASDAVAATTAATTAAPAVAATTVATTAAPTVVFDAASYVGRNRDEVVAELDALGFEVVERRVDRQGGVRPNTVVGVELDDAAEPGSTVTIEVVGGKREK